MIDSDKAYHFDQELKRLADLCERMDSKINKIQTDVAVMKSQKEIIIERETSKAKHVALGSGIGGVLWALIAMFWEYVKTKS